MLFWSENKIFLKKGRGIGSNERRLTIKLSVRNKLKLQIINNEYHIPNLSQKF